MSQFKGMTRQGRRARLAAVIVSAALALPGLALANHTTCVKQSNEVGAGINCPEFSPGLEAIIGNRVVDSETTLNYQISQADHESQLTTIEAYAPKYWQFNTQLRPSTAADCATASTANAEVISNAWTMRILSGNPRTTANLKGNAYFLSYDAPTQTISACAQPSASYKIPFTISKISNAHPYAATAGWKISIDLKPFMPTITTNDGSLVMFTLDLNQRSAGNWHRNFAGAPEKAIFSQASGTPVTTDLRADLSACRHGLNGAKTDCAVANDAITVLAKTDPFNVSPAPTVAPIDFAKLTGPARISGTLSEKIGTYRREGFGLVLGSNTTTVTWAAPTPHPDETVKGYALVMAIPGDQGSRYGKYMPTTALSTTLTRGALPRIDGNGSLDPDIDGVAKYDIALITIYNSGKRTDGRCDDGTAFGAVCAATTPLWNIKTSAHPDGYDLPGGHVGTSFWQFVWRTKSFGVTHVETAVRLYSNSAADDEIEPFLVLLVDYTRKEGEMVFWGSYTFVNTLTTSTRGISAGRASEGPGASYRGLSNLITGDGDTGAVEFSNGASPTGTARRFDFVGQTSPMGVFGLMSLTEPGDVNLGTSIPPNPTGRRPMWVATKILANDFL